MINKKFKNIKYLFPFFLFLLLTTFSFSAVLELKKIGALDTSGKVYPEWWYVGSSPVLSGVAETGKSVTIIIDENSNSVTPDSSGSWSYATQLENGDHNISISQGENKIVFVLHLGQNMPANIGSTTSGSQPANTEVPETGFNQYIALSFGVGIILLATYFYFATDSNKKKVFENRIIREN